MGVNGVSGKAVLVVNQKGQGFSDMHQARIVAVSLTRLDGELTMSTDYHGHVG